MLSSRLFSPLCPPDLNAYGLDSVKVLPFHSRKHSASAGHPKKTSKGSKASKCIIECYPPCLPAVYAMLTSLKHDFSRPWLVKYRAKAGWCSSIPIICL